ncbi:SH3 domain-containing protein [Luteibacter sp. 329MFSha]|uniref:C40 family peptidase n=1 Tax=Luteibacter sp. 329MFSha TaxID=1798239 RepID=UPI0008BC8EF3|nr:SH3 domain-containing protein [Luteibacter sp. 329MFSha]SEW05533.1 Cell wall-associated hydrolase, NlpC family [Luteibacter sp. 329MFSha]
MPLLRQTLLVALLALAIGTPAAAVDMPVPASGIPGVSDAQLSPDFWVARLADADKLVLDRAAIAALNERVARLDPSMHDIRHLPATLPRAQVTGWIGKLTTRPTKPLFDAEGKPVDASTIDAILGNAALDAVPAQVTPRYGMAVRRAALRGYPTDRRVFSRAGDTDIDRFQESTLFPGDPVVAVHTSKDGQWTFVVSARYAAWVRSDGIAYRDAAAIFAHADATPYRVITGAKPKTVYTPEAPAVSELQLDMGTRVPLDTTAPPDQPVNGQSPYTSWVLSLPVRDAQGALSFHPALLQRNQDSAPDYLPLTRANVVRQAFRFLGERYGWGHAYNGRDCSGFVSDVYRSMGVQMPRNTRDQSISPGLTHTLYTDKDSHEARLKAAMALEVGDLVYIPGHVMMVIGKVDGQPYVIHDVGGMSWKQPDGSLRRVVLNEVSVTPLLPMMFSDDATFVDRMTSIVRIR